jgi:hypothetical protein
MADGVTPTDDTGSVDSPYTKGLVDAFNVFAQAGTNWAAAALQDKMGGPDRGTGGHTPAAAAAAVPWYQQPAFMIGAAVAAVLLLGRRR